MRRAEYTSITISKEKVKMVDEARRKMSERLGLPLLPSRAELLLYLVKRFLEEDV